MLRLERLESRRLLSATTLVWDTGVALPAPRGAAAAVSGSTYYGLSGIVVVGGTTTGSSTAVEQLLPGASSWSSPSNIDISRVGPGVVSTPNGLLVFGGGGGPHGTAALDASFLYNLTPGGTEDIASLQTPRMQLAYAPDASGQAYAIGGVSDQGVNLATVERYSATAKTWTYVAPLPASRSGAAAAFDGNGSIYVVGGSATVNGSAGTSSLYEYTIATNTWTSLASLPIDVRDAAAVFGPDGQLYVFGGTSDGATVGSVETYSPATDTWSMNTSLGSPLKSAVAVVDSQSRIDLIGGFDASNQPVASVEVSQVFGIPVSATTVITSSPLLTATELGTYNYQITATGNPLPRFSLVSGPAGMNVDPVSGLLSWSVPAAFVGSAPVTVGASNVLGSVDESFTLNAVDTVAPTLPSNPTLTTLGATTATISWGASTDNVGVTGYSVYWIYTTGHSGRDGGYTTHHVLLATTDGSTTTANVTGLTPGKTYTLFVDAHDAAGNASGYSGPVNVVPGSAPYGFAASGTTTVVANHPLSLQLSSTSFTAPTYSALVPPSGLNVDPNTGAVTWTPTASEVGTNSVTFQATNAFGTASLVVAITVTADVPVPGFVFTNTDSPTFSVVGFPVGLQITDASNTPSTYSIVSGPSNASINATTGVVTWVPTADQLSGQTFTFQVANSAGTATTSVSPALYISDAPRNVTLSAITSSSPVVSWLPPLYNDALVSGYRVMIGDANGYSNSQTTTATSLALTLPGPGAYSINVQAVGALGQGLWNTVSLDYNPVPPSPTPPDPTYAITSGNGTANGVVGQAVAIQLTDLNTALPSTWSLVSGPAQMTVDPNSGVVSWTPTSADVGSHTLTFRASNSAGTADVSLTFVVQAAEGGSGGATGGGTGGATGGGSTGTKSGGSTSGSAGSTHKGKVHPHRKPARHPVHAKPKHLPKPRHHVK